MSDHQEFQSEDYPPYTSDNKAANETCKPPESISSVVSPSHSPPTPSGSTQTTQKTSKWRDNLTLGMEILGLIALIVYTIFSILQWAQIRWTNRLTREALNGNDKALTQTITKMQGQIDAANHANDLAQKAFDSSQANFRADQRPYITIGPTGSTGQFTIMTSGIHAGQIKYQFPTQNFGKSPAIVIGSDMHIAVGKQDIGNIQFHPASVHYRSVVPPGDKPIQTAYSRVVVLPTDNRPGVSVNVPRPIILYGHIDYIDNFGGNSPVYIISFCTPIEPNPIVDNDKVEEVCKSQNYIK